MNAVIDMGRATARVDALVDRNSQWPDPRPIVSDLPPAPTFDANALLPRPLAEFVNDEADRSTRHQAERDGREEAHRASLTRRAPTNKLRAP